VLPLIHPTAEVEDGATLGVGTRVWHHAQIRSGARVGARCNIGKGVFIDTEVPIGDDVKIQNYVSIFQGVALENGVFVGPHVCFTNDMFPRAIDRNGQAKVLSDWTLTQTLVRHGASLGANSTIVCGVVIGQWAMVGSGSVVTKDVPDYGLVVGNPAHLIGWVCACGERLAWEGAQSPTGQDTRCQKCAASDEPKDNP
jgi:UDP-2-acetamido-3-amino-2,3-dideoxy-glucuronate N-acetyltransferase